MEETGDLFEWAKRNLVRRSDPETACAAAIEVSSKLTSLEQQVVTALEKLGMATSNEIAAWVAVDNYGRRTTLRRRASDLVRKGAIVACGVRPCNITGKRATTYKVAEHMLSNFATTQHQT